MAVVSALSTRTGVNDDAGIPMLGCTTDVRVTGIDPAERMPENELLETTGLLALPPLPTDARGEAKVCVVMTLTVGALTVVPAVTYCDMGDRTPVGAGGELSEDSSGLLDCIRHVMPITGDPSSRCDAIGENM